MLNSTKKKLKELTIVLSKVFLKTLFCSTVLWLSFYIINIEYLKFSYIQCIGIAMIVLMTGALLRGLKL